MYYILLIFINFIRLPEIQISVPKFNICIEKFIDSELLFYIFFKNFAFWDFYVSNFLVTFRAFRKFFSKLFSKSPDVSLEGNVNIFPNEMKINKLLHEISSFSYLITIKKENGCIKNYIHRINSFSVQARDDNKEAHIFKFNFKHMRILSKLAQDRDISNFLKKILNNKTNYNGEQKMSIEYNILDTIDEAYLQVSKNLYSGDSPTHSGNRVDPL